MQVVEDHGEVVDGQRRLGDNLWPAGTMSSLIELSSKEERRR
jgi:hypothetical protein